MRMENKKTLEFWPDGLMPLPNVVSAFHSSVKDIEHIVGMAYLLLGTVKTEERLDSDVISNIQWMCEKVEIIGRAGSGV